MSRSVPRVLRHAARLFELAFFPTFCKICGTLLEKAGERILCRTCLNKITPCRLPFCLCCGRFFDGAGNPHLCAFCLEAPPHLARHRSCARYRGLLKDTLLLFKYRRFRPLGKDLARFVVESLSGEEGLWWDLDAIVPVPLHRRRKRERGFNQAEVLADEIGRLKAIPVESKVLRKTRNVPPQTSLEREARRINVKGAYEAAEPGRIAGKIVLLVDDVYTTGSTLRECAKVLKRAGAAEVRAVTVAQA